MRGSTSSKCVLPLTASSMGTVWLSLGVPVGIRDGAHEQARRRTPAVFRGSVQIGERIDVSDRRCHLLAQRAFGGRAVRKHASCHGEINERALERLEAQRNARDRPDAERKTPAYPISIKRNLGAGGGEREIAPACAHLVKSH